MLVVVVSFISSRLQQWNNTRKKLCRYQQTHWNIAASVSGHQRSHRAHQAGNRKICLLIFSSNIITYPLLHFKKLCGIGIHIFIIKVKKYCIKPHLYITPILSSFKHSVRLDLLVQQKLFLSSNCAYSFMLFWLHTLSPSIVSIHCHKNTICRYWFNLSVSGCLIRNSKIWNVKISCVIIFECVAALITKALILKSALLQHNVQWSMMCMKCWQLWTFLCISPGWGHSLVGHPWIST